MFKIFLNWTPFYFYQHSNERRHTLELIESLNPSMIPKLRHTYLDVGHEHVDLHQDRGNQVAHGDVGYSAPAEILCL